MDRWIENGCPEGNKADLPEPAQFAEGWGIDKPDQVFYMGDEPYTVPAEGVVSYKHFIVDPGFTEDHWIKQAEVKAGNPAVVHHVIVFIQQQGSLDFGDPQMAYAPGMTPRRLENGARSAFRPGRSWSFNATTRPMASARRSQLRGPGLCQARGSDARSAGIELRPDDATHPAERGESPGRRGSTSSAAKQRS